MKTFSPPKFLRLLAVALFCAATLAPASPATTRGGGDSGDPKPEAAPPFAAGEELVYQADFSRLMLRGIEIAEMRFSAAEVPTATVKSETDVAEKWKTPARVLVFNGDVRAKGWFRKLFGIDFHYHHEAVVDPVSFHILRTDKLDEQGKRVRLSRAYFDHQAGRVGWTEKNPNDSQSPPREMVSELAGATHDFISAIYFLRTQKLQPGQNFEIVVSDSGETFRVPVRVVERKTLKTVVGRVPALRVEVGLFGAGRLVGDRKGEMSIWITDDTRRLPVRAQLKADLGTLDIKLKQVATGAADANAGKKAKGKG